MIFIGQTLTVFSWNDRELQGDGDESETKYIPPISVSYVSTTSSINEYSNVYTFMILCSVPVAW